MSHLAFASATFAARPLFALLRSMVVAAGLASVAPAAAALLTYDFATSPEGAVQTHHDRFCPAGERCTFSTVTQDSGFTVVGTITVDTDRLGPDLSSTPRGADYRSENGSSQPDFLSIDLTKTGNGTPLPVVEGGAGSSYYAIDELYRPDIFNLWLIGEGTTNAYISEYRDDGTLARQYWISNLILVTIDDLIGITQFDGVDLVTAIARDIRQASFLSTTRLIEQFYDTAGNYIGSRSRITTATAPIASFTALDSIVVPEPAAAALLGLGLVGLALARRRARPHSAIISPEPPIAAGKSRYLGRPSFTGSTASA